MKINLDKIESLTNFCFVGFATIILCFFAYGFFHKEELKTPIEHKPLQLKIVKDKISQTKGLSNYDHLEDNQGMLFEFEREENHCMWNADVNFPIVVLFMDDDKQFIGIASMEAHETKPICNISRYVLEVSPAWFRQNFEQGYH